MPYKAELDVIYQAADLSMRDYSRKKTDLPGLVRYIDHYGKVFGSFTLLMNRKVSELMERFPDRMDEIESYAIEMTERLADTYDPK